VNVVTENESAVQQTENTTTNPADGFPHPQNLDEGTVRRFTASDGYEIHYRHYPASLEKPRGYVVALHGIQSHSGWYAYSCQKLSQAGFDVRFLDRRGSGLNEIDRGHAISEERLINDLAQFLAEVRHERNRIAPTQPVILQAVSWGGKLATALTAHRPELVDALALLYPGLCPRIGPTFKQRCLLALAKRLGINRKLAPIPLSDPTLFTGDESWQQFIRDDKLALHEATTGFFFANQNLDQMVEMNPEWIHCPLLLMLAGQDRIIDNEATKQLFERFGSTTRTLIEYEQAAHTLEFEPNREEIFTALVDWLETQCGAKP
jgi:alpha-beta hydrolase superfamily lysophospholipase